jgi:hypothetical protein
MRKAASYGDINNSFPYGGITRVKFSVEVRDFLSALSSSRSVVSSSWPRPRTSVSMKAVRCGGLRTAALSVAMLCPSTPMP